MTEYDAKSIATDFGGSYHGKRFKRELEDVPITGLLSVARYGDAITVTADSGQQSQIDTVVSAHNSASTSSGNQYWEDDDLGSDVLEAWVTVMTQTTAPLSAGRYRVEWQAELRLNRVGPIDSRAIAQLLIDGTDVSQGSHDGGAFDTKGGHDYITVKEGDAPVLDIRFRRAPTPGGNDTAEIRRIKLSIELWR